MVAGCFVATLGGLLVGAAWLQSRGSAGLLWWAAGHFVNAAGSGVFAYGLATTDSAMVIAGVGGIVASMTLYWGGVRVFLGRRPCFG